MSEDTQVCVKYSPGKRSQRPQNATGDRVGIKKHKEEKKWGYTVFNGLCHFTVPRTLFKTKLICTVQPAPLPIETAEAASTQQKPFPAPNEYRLVLMLIKNNYWETVKS
jgi:hypothetical protein